MAVLTDFLDSVAIDVPGCPNAVILDAIKNTLIDFCERGRVLRREAMIDAVGGVTPAEILPPTSMVAATERLVSIEYMELNGLKIYSKTPDQIACLYPQWQTQIGTPLYYTQLRPQAYWLVPYLGATQTLALLAEMFVAPLRTASTYDDTLLNYHYEPIVAGAKGRLMLMKDKPWTDASMGATNLGIFEGSIASNQVKQFRGTARAKLDTKIHSF